MRKSHSSVIHFVLIDKNARATSLKKKTGRRRDGEKEMAKKTASSHVESHQSRYNFSSGKQRHQALSALVSITFFSVCCSTSSVRLLCTCACPVPRSNIFCIILHNFFSPSLSFYLKEISTGHIIRAFIEIQINFCQLVESLKAYCSFDLFFPFKWPPLIFIAKDIQCEPVQMT